MTSHLWAQQTQAPQSSRAYVLTPHGAIKISGLGQTAISLAVCTSKALAVDRLLRNEKLTDLSHRGLGATGNCVVEPVTLICPATPK